MNVAQRLMEEVKMKRPDLYEAILMHIRPHHLNSLLKLFECHLRKIDLEVLNRNREAIPDFCWTFVRHCKFPSPGDPFGIQLTCRITKTDTQDSLDSKHISSVLHDESATFNVNKSILDELRIFSSQLQVFEYANRRQYASVFLTQQVTVQDVLARIPEVGLLERGAPFNKGKDKTGVYRYLDTFRFVLVVDRGLKILYESSRDLCLLLKYLPINYVGAVSDIRYIFQKCGIVGYYFNLLELVYRQLLNNDGSIYEKDVLTVIKYQCRSGIPLPLTRDGLAKNPDRTPIEILSFEAPKKNYARLSTGPMQGKWFDVRTSSDKIFFGQQFNEGTGYHFALLPSLSNKEINKNEKNK